MNKQHLLISVIALNSICTCDKAMATGFNANGAAATYNTSTGSWSYSGGTQTGTPNFNQTNNFSGGLTVSGDGSNPLNLSAGSPSSTTTNNVSGIMQVESPKTYLRATSGGTVNNNIANAIVTSGTADFTAVNGTSTNCIGSLIASSTAGLNSAGGITNNYLGDVTVNSGGTVSFYNAPTYITAATVTGLGNKTVTEYLSNQGIATTGLTPTGTLTINGGTIVLGGSPFMADKLIWNGGEIQINITDPGTNSFTDVTFPSSSTATLTLTNDYSGDKATISDVSTTFTLFTASGTISGNPSNVLLNNNSPFHEIAQTGITQATVGTDGTVTLPSSSTALTVTLTPTDIIDDDIDSTIVDVAGDLVRNLQGNDTALAVGFTSNTYSRQQTTNKMKRAFIEHRESPFEAAINAFSQAQTPLVGKFKGDWRVWVSPYVIHTRNTVSPSSGFTANNYGILVGCGHYFSSIGTSISASIGVGLTKSKKDTKANSKSKSTNLILGLTATKIFQGTEVISSLYTIVTKNAQTRQHDPSPSQHYTATAHYYSGMLSWDNEIGRVFKFQNNFSIRPNIGLQLVNTYRQAFREENDPLRQIYHRRVRFYGEVYAGVGFRQKWDGLRYEGKITLSYEIGRVSGKGKSSITVYADSVPQGVNFSGKTPGRTVHYFTLYGSVLDKECHWKIKPGLTYTLQTGQHSLSGTINLEYRW
jgi:hypothetical protein